MHGWFFNVGGGEFHHQKQGSVLLGGANSLQEDNGMKESIGLNDGEGNLECTQ